MLLKIDKNKTVKTETHTCAFHREHPSGVPFAGCTCSASYGAERVPVKICPYWTHPNDCQCTEKSRGLLDPSDKPENRKS